MHANAAAYGTVLCIYIYIYIYTCIFIYIYILYIIYHSIYIIYMYKPKKIMSAYVSLS